MSIDNPRYKSKNDASMNQAVSEFDRRVKGGDVLEDELHPPNGVDDDALSPSNWIYLQYVIMPSKAEQRVYDALGLLGQGNVVAVRIPPTNATT